MQIMIGNILIVITVLLWGVGSFLGKVALKEADPAKVYFLEALGTLTIACLAAIYFRKEVTSAFTSFTLASYAFGVLYGIGTVTFIFALKYKIASTAIPLTALYPLVAVLLAALFLQEPITLKTGLGIILAVSAGMLLS